MFLRRRLCRVMVWGAGMVMVMVTMLGKGAGGEGRGLVGRGRVEGISSTLLVALDRHLWERTRVWLVLSSPLGTSSLFELLFIFLLRKWFLSVFVFDTRASFAPLLALECSWLGFFFSFRFVSCLLPQFIQGRFLSKAAAVSCSCSCSWYPLDSSCIGGVFRLSRRL